MSDRQTSEPRRWWAGVVGVALWTALAAWLRWQRLTLGPTSDEIGQLMPFQTVSGVLWDQETAVNPPLLRWWMNLGFDLGDAIAGGRGLVFVASVATVPAAAALVWRGSGWMLGAVLAAGFVALHPYAVQLGAMARAYGLAGLAAAVLLLSAQAHLREPERRRWEIGVAVATVALGWIHYLAVSIALGVGLVSLTDPAARRLRIPVGVGLALLLPLAAVVWSLGNHKTHVAPAEVEPLVRFFVSARAGLGSSRLTVSAVAAVGVLVAAVWGRAPDDTGRRMAAAAALSWCAAVAGAEVYQPARATVDATGVAVVTPAVLLGLARTPGRWRLLLGLWMAWWSAPHLSNGVAWLDQTAGQQQAFPDLVASWDEAVGEAAVLAVEPPHRVGDFWHVATGEQPGMAPQDAPECTARGICVPWRGTAVVGRDAPAPEPAEGTRWFRFDDQPDPYPGCTVRWRSAAARVVDCAAVP